jgi:hypothetical protein
LGANHWIKTGPHVMIVGAEPSFYDGYPKGANPDTSVPYIMWAGTLVHSLPFRPGIGPGARDVALPIRRRHHLSTHNPTLELPVRYNS